MVWTVPPPWPLAPGFGARLGFDAEAAAWGIARSPLAEMTKGCHPPGHALGSDPREHPLISYRGLRLAVHRRDRQGPLRAQGDVPDVASVL